MLGPAPSVTARLPAAQRRRQLLDTALDVFGALGYHRASMDAVAEAAGVTKPVLYQHFGSKRELYLEVLGDVGTRLMDTVALAARRAGTPRQQVEAGFRAYFNFVRDHAGAFRLLFGGLDRDDEFAAVAANVQETMAQTVAELIAVEVDAEHRQILAHGVIGLAESTSRRWIGQDLDLDPDVLAARVAELAWAGLRGIRPQPRS
ncbi:MAG: TetR/AcrR family transcriptional regulator [Acidimicrobiales bacterium]